MNYTCTECWQTKAGTMKHADGVWLCPDCRHQSADTVSGGGGSGTSRSAAHTPFHKPPAHTDLVTTRGPNDE